MSYTLEPLDSEARAREKQASREQDEAELASNAVTRSDLKRRNGFFSSLSLRDFRIVAIGGREIGNEKWPGTAAQLSLKSFRRLDKFSRCWCFTLAITGKIKLCDLQAGCLVPI